MSLVASAGAVRGGAMGRRADARAVDAGGAMGRVAAGLARARCSRSRRRSLPGRSPDWSPRFDPRRQTCSSRCGPARATRRRTVRACAGSSSRCRRRCRWYCSSARCCSYAACATCKEHDFGYAVPRLAFATVEYDTRDSARDARGRQSRFAHWSVASRRIPGVERRRAHELSSQEWLLDDSLLSRTPTRRCTRSPAGFITGGDAVATSQTVGHETAPRTHVRASGSQRRVHDHHQSGDGRCALAEPGSDRPMCAIRHAEPRRARRSSASCKRR